MFLFCTLYIVFLTLQCASLRSGEKCVKLCCSLTHMKGWICTSPLQAFSVLGWRVGDKGSVLPLLRGHFHPRHSQLHTVPVSSPAVQLRWGFIHPSCDECSSCHPTGRKIPQRHHFILLIRSPRLVLIIYFKASWLNRLINLLRFHIYQILLPKRSSQVVPNQGLRLQSADETKCQYLFISSPCELTSSWWESREGGSPLGNTLDSKK